MSNGGDDYYPLTIARSDGKGYSFFGPSNKTLALDFNETKDVEQKERWEVIIAGHIAQQIFPKTETRQFKLSDFPKGYELRCTLRKDGAGRDYFLYGHPAGITSLYRTPGEFVLHALWLLSSSTDPAGCSCDHCVKLVETNKSKQPRGPSADEPPAPAPAQPPKGPVPKSGKDQSAPGPPAPGKPAPEQGTQGQYGKQQSVQHGMPPTVQQGKYQIVQQSNPSVSVAQPLPSIPAVPQSLSQGQVPPGTTGLSNVFRVGEMVWYKQQAWRLGLILATVPKPAAQPPYDDSSYTFVLAPLGHALLSLKQLQKEAIDMRPFLTFSVPAVAIDELASKFFEAVDWQAFAIRYSQDPDPQKRNLKLQMVGLEASKMAARGINDCFSTFNKLREGPTPDGTVLARHYTGVYLGAEMVRLGDPVRVNAPGGAHEPPGTSPCVMLVSEIKVLTSAWGGDANTPATLQFEGNVYRVVRAALPHPPTIIAAENLGQAFVEELSVRNEIERDPNVRWGWHLVQRDAVRPDGEVRGRFYVTFKLMALINPKTLEENRARGAVEEAQTYLNNRSHSGLGGNQGGRRESRAATLGKAVSTQFVAPSGMVED